MIFNTGVKTLSQMLEGFRRQSLQDKVRNFIRTQCLVAFSASSEFLELSRGNFFKVFRTRFV